ncbi:MAG: hypothetical protein FWE66_00380, partial [Oscillospiraceae bacterium]|nr:hypothetical protein [Oscillospiraceae bacterium]
AFITSAVTKVMNDTITMYVISIFKPPLMNLPDFAMLIFLDEQFVAYSKQPRANDENKFI